VNGNMGEKAPSKLFRTLQILIPLASVAVGITGVLLTVAARKKEITCTLVNSTRLVNQNLGGIHPDLHVEFHGQSIFSLAKMTFDMRNTGAAAILEKDIVQPVRLVFPAGTKLMSSNVEKTFPSDLKFSARALPDSETIELEFPLLNRGDEAFFSVYVLNSEPQRPALEGRIVEVPQLIYSEANIGAVRQSMWPFQSHATRSVVRWVLVSIYGALTLLFLGLWIGCITSYAKYLPWKRKWKDQYDEVVDELKNAANNEEATVPQEHPAQVAKAGVPISADEQMDPEALYRHMLTTQHALMPSRKLNKELKEKGIAPHPGSFIDSISALAGFSALLLSLAAVCSTTGLVVYRGLSN
jgi:hypothetical protein